jgi:general stress protein 26
MSTITDTREKVYDILKGFSTAMFVTVGPGGRPEARPMQVARVEDSGEIWFFTGRGGTVATEIKEEAVVLLSFQKDNSAYLSLRGKSAECAGSKPDCRVLERAVPSMVSRRARRSEH